MERKYTRSQFLTLIRCNPGLSTARIAGRLGCSVRTAQRRLAELAESGRARRVQQGRSCAWVAIGEPTTIRRVRPALAHLRLLVAEGHRARRDEMRVIHIDELRRIAAQGRDMRASEYRRAA